MGCGALLLCLCGPKVVAQTDDFSDGDDDGWIKYDPFAMAGVGSRVSFDPSGGTYRMSCLASPNPLLLGPARGAAFRPDLYVDFGVSVDVPVHDQDLEQAFGILARTTANPAPGAVFGYAMTYHPVDDDIQITRLDNEQVTEISPYVPLWGPPASGVLRVVFFGEGDRLVGRVYDAADPVVPLAETVVTDATYPSGMCGIAIFDNTETADQAADVTFDNYHAGDGTPGPLRIDMGSGGDLVLSWEFPFATHDLEWSADLMGWDATRFQSEWPAYANGILSHTTSVSESGSGSFFRLSREPLP